MKGSVALETLRFVDEPVSAAKVCVDGAQVVKDCLRSLIEEDGAAALAASSRRTFWPSEKRAEDSSEKSIRLAAGLHGLEDFVVADRHSWWSFDWLRWYELCGITLEVIDAGDECGTVDRFRRVCKRRGRGELFEEIVNMRASDGAGLSGRLRGDCK
jgi:hypothetical protein